MNSKTEILIVGASTRAAAFSALRAGLRPRCIDWFADCDLQNACPTVRIEPPSGVAGFAPIAEAIPPSPWFYTGPLENHPELVERISFVHSLKGNDSKTLRAARNPFRVAESLGQAGLPYPTIHSSPAGLSRDGDWLIKPVASGGGRQIVPLDREHDRLPEPSYVQERIRGPVCSALFLGEGDRAALIGVTSQLLGAPGSPYAYKGSIGPWPISVSLASDLCELGDALTAAFGLIGLFGVDYILNEGRPWPVEINPRYTASVEVHELATGRPLLTDHLKACEFSKGDRGPRPRFEPSAPRRIVGKVILYAQRNLLAPEIEPESGLSTASDFEVPSIADIPWPRSRILAGEPVMTVFATGETVEECGAALDRIAADWMNRLDAAPDFA